MSETKCSYMSEYKDTVWLEDIYGQWFGYYLSLAFLPSAIIVVCNVIVIYQIKKREGKQQSSNSKGRTVVQMLVSASVLFIIFTLGASIAEELRNVEPENWPEDAVETRDDFLDNINELLNTCNNSFNFFIYVLTSERFRTAFLMIFGLNKNHKSQQSAHSMQTRTNQTAAENQE